MFVIPIESSWFAQPQKQNFILPRVFFSLNNRMVVVSSPRMQRDLEIRDYKLQRGVPDQA